MKLKKKKDKKAKSYQKCIGKQREWKMREKNGQKVVEMEGSQRMYVIRAL